MDINEDFDKFNILELAKNKECFSLLLMVLENLEIYNFDINSQDEDGNTLLHLLIIYHQDQYILVKYLLRLNPDINKTNNIKETPIYLACVKEELPLVKLLLNKGANLKVYDFKNKSLLHIAVEKNNLELCRYLINYKIDVNHQDNNGETALHYAIEQKLIKITFLLIHKTNLNKEDNDGYTPLHVASKVSTELLKLLLRNKVSKDKKTFNGDLPLHLAASFGNLESVVVLLQDECKIEVLNNDNYTPAKLAKINGHEKVQQLLLRLSTNVSTCRPSSNNDKFRNIYKKKNSNGFTNCR